MHILTIKMLDLFCELYQAFYDVVIERDMDDRCEIRHASGEIALVRVFKNLDDIPLLKTALMGHFGKNMPFNKKYGYDHTYVMHENRLIYHYGDLFLHTRDATTPLTEDQENILVPAVIHEIRHGVQSDNPNLVLRTMKVLGLLRRCGLVKPFSIWHDDCIQRWENLVPKLNQKFIAIDTSSERSHTARFLANEEDAYATQFLSEYFWAATRGMERKERIHFQKSLILN